TKKQKEISSEDQELIDRLNLCMAEKNLYRDYKLGLNDLAEELQINPNQLSALLNEQIGKSFYDYINEFRIEEVKKRLVDTAYQNQTILSIAWDCGFNSKSAFNRIFKTLTGLTPSAYQKKYSKR
ncbi:MAG: helix-turn-helix domain-containing protein, partial [Carboxylicivirga sp.]|nr:helix-turn-helix domain-containing protein [Carboxylicivirga sp.]